MTMSREFIIGERHAGSNLNSRYYFDFRHIANNTLGTAYSNKRYEETYPQEEIQKLRSDFKEKAGELVRQMWEEEPQIDEKINRLISACYIRWISKDWKLEKFSRQLNSGRRIWERRLKSTRASYILKDRVF